MNNDPIHVLSLGAGVQSSTLALMAALGEISPMPTAAIFADTQAEPATVYKWLDWLETKLTFPVIRVTNGSLTERVTTTRTNRKNGNVYYSNMIPAQVLNADGTKGIAGRSCTADFKIVPINKQFRALVGLPALAAWRKAHPAEWAEAKAHPKRCRPATDPLVTQWIGISLDEVQRMKHSRLPWILHRWPLIEARMTRHDCLLWMKKRGFPAPPRSACVYCPFHSDAEWRRLKDHDPAGFQEAVRVEVAMQGVHKFVTTPGKFVGIPFLHKSLKPLSEVDFSTDEETGQQTFGQECEGMCGV